MLNHHFWTRIAALVLIGFCLPNLALAQETDDDKADQVRELIQDARQSLGAEDYEEAAKSLAKAVKLDPKNGLAWQLHGYALHADGKLDDAIKSHKKASEFERTRGIALYNLGCAYSLKKEKKKAMDYLDKAIDAGFVTLQYFETDSDLDNLRKEKRFKKIVEVVKNGGRKKTQETEGKKEQEKEKKKKSDFDAKVLIGKWKVVSGTRSGEDIDGRRLPPQISISKKAFTIPSGGDDNFVMSYKINGSKKPAHIDFKIESGPVPEGKAIGIIKVEKNKMTLCYDSTGQERPEKFKTEEDDSCFMFVLERIKEKKGKKADKTDK